ncbi:MAG: zinc ribbon domain-containing protein [Lutibacter sp.]|uniref:FmdB family zinc ribbon protein n=1 Tax=Lutibacter sp. TaxID=1925666 RepID=UPI0019F47398|nr:zinc ribbon domain-containing protein [Lutibacter sp.]
MPIYILRCKNCEREIEELVFNKDKIFKCNNCGTVMKKVMSASNFVINGYSEKNSYGLKK